MKSIPSRSSLPALLVLLFLCHTSQAQELDPTHGEQKAAMSKLKPLVREWKGSGWIQFGPRRFEFESSEVFVEKAGGLAIVVEGLHHMPMPDGTKRVVHNAVAMINFDAKSDRYRFATQLTNGRAGTYHAMLTEDGDFRWIIPDTPLGKMVYTISFQKDGNYCEIGELVSKSGGRKKFFEMNLQKVKRAT
jgi:hypothetical protein